MWQQLALDAAPPAGAGPDADHSDHDAHHRGALEGLTVTDSNDFRWNVQLGASEVTQFNYGGLSPFEVIAPPNQYYVKVPVVGPTAVGPVGHARRAGRTERERQRRPGGAGGLAAQGCVPDDRQRPVPVARRVVA